MQYHNTERDGMEVPTKTWELPTKRWELPTETRPIKDFPGTQYIGETPVWNVEAFSFSGNNITMGKWQIPILGSILREGK